MKSILTGVIFTGFLVPSTAWTAPPDTKPLDRAAAVMDDCGGIAGQIAALAAPAGLARGGAAEFINEQAGGDLVPVDPAIDKFIKQITGMADRLGDCGKTYKAALKDSEALIAGLQDAKLSQQDSAAVGPAMDRYGAAAEKLETAMEGLSLKEELQPYVSGPLQDYFLKGAAEPAGAPRALSSGGRKLPPAGAGMDPQLARQLKEMYQKERARRLQAEEKKKKVKPAAAQEPGAQMSPKAAAAVTLPDKEPGNPMSRGDKNKVMNWIAEGVAAARQPYCYRLSYGRGVGVPLSSCPADKEKDAWLCYPKCKSGYDGVGPVCWQGCPGGYVDTGAFCHINKPLTKKGKWECVKRVFGICIMKALDCPGGYVNAGLFCALKTPPVPPGYKGLSGLDIIKDSYGRGVGAPMDCAAGKQEDAGLCYEPCRQGYSGVGPVCWMQCTGGRTECGLGCTDGKISCVTNTANMVVSPLMLASFIASGGALSTSGVFPQIVQACKIGSATNEARESVTRWVTDAVANFDKLTTPEIKKELHAGCAGHPKAEEWLKEQYALQHLALMVEKDAGETGRDFLAGISAFDPSGATGVASAYWQPKCSPLGSFPEVRFLTSD